MDENISRALANISFKTPVILFCGRFKVLTPNERMVYVALLNRKQFSKESEKRFFDRKDDTFIIYKGTELAKRFNLSLRQVQNILRRLKDFGLVNVCQKQLGKPAQIYVTDIIEILDENTVNEFCETYDINLMEIVKKVQQEWKTKKQTVQDEYVKRTQSITQNEVRISSQEHIDNNKINSEKE